MLTQNIITYQEEDHVTWQTLSRRQKLLLDKKISKVSKEYLTGYSKLNLSTDRIIDIDEMSERLESISGWSLVPVDGLIPTKDFFYMLINKKYPVTVSIRRPHEVDFSENPDIFHDIVGHLPLLTNEKFVKFLTAYSVLALKYINNERAVELLGRLYWYTYEMGIIHEDGENKPYGGAVITSAKEIDNMKSDHIPKYDFRLSHIFATPYNPYALQNEYFVIQSFDDLFHSLAELETTLIEQLLLHQPDSVLRNYSINSNIGRDFNNVIGFLNDTQYKYPSAMSFVAGQPDDTFFEIEDHLSKFSLFVEYRMKLTGRSRREVVNEIGQYGKTSGIINDLLADYLRNDENISVQGKDILVTTGAQEAFSIIVSTLCNKEKDVILVEDPSYIGLSSFAKVFSYSIEGVPTDEEGIYLKDLKNKLIEINSSGRRVKILYVIPDYQNPSGSCMPIGNRLKLLELAQQYNFLIIEDSVYNSFTYAQKKNPTLKSLDKHDRVIYVGSFSKSLFPGLRIGLIAANQKIENDLGHVVPLIQEMMKVKAQLTNNTSALSQGVLGGVLIDLNFSLSEWSIPKFESYKRKRDKVVESLQKYISAYNTTWAKNITWKEPSGGFFMKIAVPFEINNEAVVESASNFNVIFCPMRFFYLKGGGEYELRITFSNIPYEQIDTGIKRLADFFKSKIISTKITGQVVAETVVTN